MTSMVSPSWKLGSILQGLNLCRSNHPTSLEPPCSKTPVAAKSAKCASSIFLVSPWIFFWIQNLQSARNPISPDIISPSFWIQNLHSICKKPNISPNIPYTPWSCHGAYHPPWPAAEVSGHGHRCAASRCDTPIPARRGALSPAEHVAFWVVLLYIYIHTRIHTHIHDMT